MTPATALLNERRTQVCDICLKIGHTADRCWKVYPDLKPSRETLAKWRAKQDKSKQEPPECTFCGEVGHLASVCRVAHPELKPSKADLKKEQALKKKQESKKGQESKKKQGSKKKQQQSQDLKVERELDPRYHQGKGPLTTEALIWNPKLGIPNALFDIDVDAKTGRVRFPRGLRFWFDSLGYGPRFLPGRCVISLALNEVGRRLACGMVYWTKTLGDDSGGRFDMLYLGKRWSERECEAWDEMTHEERLKARDAVGLLDWDEWVVPVAVGWQYMENWVVKEIGGGDEDGEHRIESGLCPFPARLFLTLSFFPSFIQGLGTRLGTSLTQLPAAKNDDIGALLVYESARAGMDNPPSVSRHSKKGSRDHTSNPPSVNRHWNKGRPRPDCGVPHLSTLKTWANCGGSDRDGISWADNLKWMSMAVKKGNDGVMRSLQKMWHGGEHDVVVVHKDVAD